MGGSRLLKQVGEEGEEGGEGGEGGEGEACRTCPCQRREEVGELLMSNHHTTTPVT